MDAIHRRDIDGLRAVAVLSVVLYHLGVPGFGGGFVGVDVFFVISGFLITGIVTRDLDVGRFSLTEFYRRRALRILPALFGMLVVATLVATISLLPAELSDFAGSVIASVLFASNVRFASREYFGTAADVTPLLHTWSLGVEEQFYLVWPPLLLLATGKGPRTARVLAVAVAVLSFGYSLYELRVNPARAFNLLPSRAWELMVGAVLAGLTRSGSDCPRHARVLLSVLGLTAILVAVAFYDARISFPGVAALLPVLGTMAVIAAGQEAPANRLLTTAPLVYVGKVSYSLYLWHWPVIVFSRLWFGLEPTALVKSMLLAVALALAIASYRWIETPFRRRASRLSRKQVFLGSAGVTTALATVAAGIVIADGLPMRLTPQQQSMAAYSRYEANPSYRAGECFLVLPGDSFKVKDCLDASGDPSLLIVGDSHAAHLWPGLKTLSGPRQVLQATMSNCPPLLHRVGRQVRCDRFTAWLFQTWLPKHPVDTILLAAQWTPGDFEPLRQTIGELKPFAKQVVVVGPVPHYVASLPRLLVQRIGAAGSAPAQMDALASTFQIDRDLEAVVIGTPAKYFSVAGALCKEGHCRAYAHTDVPLQFDESHLTEAGSRVVAEELLGSSTMARFRAH